MTVGPAIDGDTTINQLVQRARHVLPVLQKYGIDSCCGGALPLREVATRHRLALADLLAELGQAAAGEQ